MEDCRVVAYPVEPISGLGLRCAMDPAGRVWGLWVEFVVKEKEFKRKRE
jgi:hypothetical protein